MINIDPVVAGRINAAWKQLGVVDPKLQSLLATKVLSANQQAVSIAQTGKAPTTPPEPQYLLLAHSTMKSDSDGVVAGLNKQAVSEVTPDGVIWGTGKYEQLDPGWVEAFASYLESLITGKHPFMADPQIIALPNDVQIGLAGDWGTGDWRMGTNNPTASTDVGTHMAFLQPHVTVHLGDVYYAGTSSQEQHLLVDIWPKGSIGSLALNSNHEMYSGAKPYFAAIARPAPPATTTFGIQGGCSYFALENDNWVIVGLDSAYFSPSDGLYRDGSLGPDGGTQVQFLQQQVAKGKKVIVLTHHNGLSGDGSKPTTLWQQVISAFPPGTGPAYWYWGHFHAGIVYQPQPPGNILCRCCGHGALPWGLATELENNPHVAWFESRSANDPAIPLRVLNGFAMLYLDGPNFREVLYDENGGVAWPSAPSRI